MVLGTKFDGVNFFISLTCIAKEYKDRYGKKYNVSLGLRNIHESYVIKGRGAGAKCYLKATVLEFFLSRQKSFPKEFCDELRSSVELLKNDGLKNQKSFAVDIVTSFLLSSNKFFTIKHDKCVGDKLYEILLCNKVLIEFVDNSQGCVSQPYKVGIYDCLSFNVEERIGEQLGILCLNIGKITGQSL